MKSFKKEYLLFVIAFAVAIVGLLQLFHEPVYAGVYCSPSYCECTDPCTDTDPWPCNVQCSPTKIVPTNCRVWCGCGQDPCWETR